MHRLFFVFLLSFFSISAQASRYQGYVFETGPECARRSVVNFSETGEVQALAVVDLGLSRSRSTAFTLEPEPRTPEQPEYITYFKHEELGLRALKKADV